MTKNTLFPIVVGDRAHGDRAKARLLGTWARDRPGDVLCVAVALILGAFVQCVSDKCAYNVRTERTSGSRHARQLRPQRPQEAHESEHQQ